MNTPRKKSSQVKQVLKLVNELTPRQQAEVKRSLELRDWGKEWDKLAKSVRDRNKRLGISIPSEEEVAAEFTAYRREQKAKRAKSHR